MRYGIILAVFFQSFLCFSQGYVTSFNADAKYISKVYEISYKKPKGFVDLKKVAFWKPGGRKFGVTSIHEHVFQSKDNNCTIMYPDKLLFSPNWNFSPRSQIVGEIKALLGLVDERGHDLKDSIDFDKYVKIYTAADARRHFNADTVFMADLPLNQPYMERYRYCTGLYIVKENRPPLLFKIFMTEEGKVDEKKYLEKIYRRVWYRNDNWVYDEEKDTKAGFEILYKDRYGK